MTWNKSLVMYYIKLYYIKFLLLVSKVNLKSLTTLKFCLKFSIFFFLPLALFIVNFLENYVSLRHKYLLSYLFK